MRIDQREWEGMGILIVFLHTSSLGHLVYLAVLPAERQIQWAACFLLCRLRAWWLCNARSF